MGNEKTKNIFFQPMKPYNIKNLVGVYIQDRKSFFEERPLKEIEVMQKIRATTTAYSGWDPEYQDYTMYLETDGNESYIHIVVGKEES